MNIPHLHVLWCALNHDCVAHDADQENAAQPVTSTRGLFAGAGGSGGEGATVFQSDGAQADVAVAATDGGAGTPVQPGTVDTLFSPDPAPPFMSAAEDDNTRSSRRRRGNRGRGSSANNDRGGRRGANNTTGGRSRGGANGARTGGNAPAPLSASGGGSGAPAPSAGTPDGSTARSTAADRLDSPADSGTPVAVIAPVVVVIAVALLALCAAVAVLLGRRRRRRRGGGGSGAPLRKEDLFSAISARSGFASHRSSPGAAGGAAGAAGAAFMRRTVSDASMSQHGPLLREESAHSSGEWAFGSVTGALPGRGTSDKGVAFAAACLPYLTRGNARALLVWCYMFSGASSHLLCMPSPTAPSFDPHSRLMPGAAYNADELRCRQLCVAQLERPARRSAPAAL